MSLEPLYESVKRVVIRARLVAVMRELGAEFDSDIVQIHEIACRSLTHDELERASEPFS
jgi:hypothetical protein